MNKKTWAYLGVLFINLINTYLCLFESTEDPFKLWMWWFFFLIISLLVCAVINFSSLGEYE